MEKKVKDLTTQEQENICDPRRQQSNGCTNCPLCFGRICTLCYGIITDDELAQLFCLIGDNVVEV